MRHILLSIWIFSPLVLASHANAQVGGQKTQRVEIFGQIANGHFGQTVTSAGDVNADGVDDLLIGSPGSFSIQLVEVISGADGQRMRQYSGAPFFGIGGAIAGLGDINGDGFADVAFGNPSGATVFAVSGFDDQILWSQERWRRRSSLGNSMVAIDDIDGDGIGELLVGDALGDLGSLDFAGQAFVFSGATGQQLMHFRGQRANGKLGQNVAAAGDVNGDGFPDLMVDLGLGPQSQYYTRVLHIYSGADGSLLFEKPAPSGLFGDTSFDGVGDLNQDGFDDFAIGYPNAIVSAGVAGLGKVRIFSGATGEIMLLVEGESSGGTIGNSVSPADDYDADGYPDFFLGSVGDFVLGIPSKAKIHSGLTGKPIAQFFTWDDAAPSTLYGDRIQNLGDTDGDGYSEFAVSDWGFRASGASGNSGRVLVYSFHPLMTASVSSVSASAGGSVDLRVDFPDSSAGNPYAVLLSAKRSVTRGYGVALPLDDGPRMRASAHGIYPFASHAGFMGSLDAQGNATATVNFLPGELPISLVDTTLFFAAVSGATTSVMEASSIAVPLRILP